MSSESTTSVYVDLLSKRIQSLERDRFVLIDLLKTLVISIENNDHDNTSSIIDNILKVLSVVDKNDLIVSDNHEDVYPNIDCVTNSCFLCKILECKFNKNRKGD